MVTLGVFLLYLIHLGSTETTQTLHITPNYETCVEADLKEIESLKEEFFKELPLKEIGNNKNLTSFGLLAEDWVRLHELEKELPKDSIMKSRLLKAFRLLIAALYQAHLKQAYRQHFDQRNATTKDISSRPNDKCNQNTSMEKCDLVEVESVNLPISNQTINKKPTNGRVDVDNEVAGSDNEETELSYPHASPTNNLTDTLTPRKDISNVKVNDNENTFSETSTHETILNNYSTRLVLNNPSISDVEEFGITHLTKNSDTLLTSTPSDTNPKDEEYFTNSEEISEKDESGIPSTFKDSFTTTESYNKSLEESHARNTTIYSIENNNFTENFNIRFKNRTLLNEQKINTESEKITNLITTTENYEDSVENTSEMPFTIHTPYTGKPNLVPIYDDGDTKGISDNFNSQDYAVNNGDSLESSPFSFSSSTSGFPEIEEGTNGKGPNKVYLTTPHPDLNSTSTYQKHHPELGPSTKGNTPEVTYDNRILPDYDPTTIKPTIADNFSTTTKGIVDIQKDGNDYNNDQQLTVSTNVSDNSQSTTPSFIQNTQHTRRPTSLKYIRTTHSDKFENYVPVFSQTMEITTDGFTESRSHINTVSDDVTHTPTTISNDLPNQNTISVRSSTLSFGKYGNTNSNSMSKIIPTQGSMWPISSPKPSMPSYFDNSLYDDDYEGGGGGDDNDDVFNLNSNEDVNTKDFPDGQEIDLPESKGGSDYLGPNKGFATKTTPTQHFKQFTVTFKKLFETHNDDVGTNKLDIYQKRNHAEIRPLQASFTNCRSGDQCVRVKNFEFPHFSSNDRNIQMQTHPNSRYLPYVRGSQMPNNVHNLNVDVPNNKYQRLPSLHGWR